jgi:hypothetical protein
MIQHETSHADGKTYTLARYSLSNHFFYYAPGMLKLSRWSIASAGQTHLNCYMREGFGLMGWGDEQSPEAFCRFA